MHSIKPLTSIRFLAAFYVLLFHCLRRWNIPVIPKFIQNIVTMGPMAMSLFFILSGFILCYNYYEMNFKVSYIDFLIKRFARIYPIYLIASILTIPFIIFKVNPDFLKILELHNVPIEIFKVFQFAFLVLTNIILIQA